MAGELVLYHAGEGIGRLRNDRLSRTEKMGEWGTRKVDGHLRLRSSRWWDLGCGRRWHLTNTWCLDSGRWFYLGNKEHWVPVVKVNVTCEVSAVCS